MRVSVTATRHGLTVRQQGEAMRWLHRLRKGEGDAVLSHGCCVEGDEFLHRLARGLGFQVVGRPSNLPDKTMALRPDEFLRIHEPEPPLLRDRKLVTFCDVLLACPRQRREVRRSGTWATYRYAADCGVTVIVVWP